MQTAPDVIELLAIVFAVGLVAELLANALRLPRMVVLLFGGVLVGPNGLGLVDVPLAAVGVQLVLSLGVSFILFYGGLGLSLDVLRRVGVGLGLLAVPGVVLTTAVVGGVAALVFGIPLEAGLLIGAIVAPTDPAILIPLFERLRIRAKVAQTIVAESALNDPTSAVLALAVAAFVLEGDEPVTQPLVDFVVHLGVSSAIGLLFGVALAAAISTRRIGIWRESPALAVGMIVAAEYASIDWAGGSGYLGAFIAGVVAGNADAFRLDPPKLRAAELRHFAQLVTDVVVIVVFVLLGASLPLGRMADGALPALAVVAALLVVARPLTVLTCLLPDRRGGWTRAEIAFLVWTRETGVVPAALAALLIARGVGYEDEILTVVALAIVVTLLVQATTKAWLARRLGLVEHPGP